MRQRLAGVLCVVSAFVVLASCGGGGGGTPTAPTTPTAMSIIITSSSVTLLLGLTETFTAMVTLSNGTTQALTGGTWGTDAPAVATVNASTGLVTSVGPGDVTIFVDAQGVRGTKRITVVPNYQGIFSGTYSVTSCTQSGDFTSVNLCGTYPLGTELPVGFNLTQTGATITGQTALGGLVSAQFTTVAASNGVLTFQALFTLDTFKAAQAWQLSLPQAGRLAGNVVQTWTDSTLIGQAVLAGTLVNVVKTSSDHVQGMRSGPAPRSLAEVLAAFSRR